MRIHQQTCRLSKRRCCGASFSRKHLSLPRRPPHRPPHHTAATRAGWYHTSRTLRLRKPIRPVGRVAQVLPLGSLQVPFWDTGQAPVPLLAHPDFPRATQDSRWYERTMSPKRRGTTGPHYHPPRGRNSTSIKHTAVTARPTSDTSNKHGASSCTMKATQTPRTIGVSMRALSGCAAHLVIHHRGSHPRGTMKHDHPGETQGAARPRWDCLIRPPRSHLLETAGSASAMAALRWRSSGGCRQGSSGHGGA
jgi:hypothetical protein